MGSERPQSPSRASWRSFCIACGWTEPSSTGRRRRLPHHRHRPGRDIFSRRTAGTLWSRYCSFKKVDAAIDHWMKNVAPSSELRRWFAHDPVRWKEFQRRYKKELKQRQKEINELRTLARHSSITLIFAARDEEHNEAVVLRDFLLRQ